jgi:trans-aconitate methyltransferase
VELSEFDESDPERSRQRDLVRAGYDVISRKYRDDEGNPAASSSGRTGPYRAWIDELVTHLPPGARVLDLGCGAGVPAASRLVKAGCQVTGVDFSGVQIERARELVPDATFVEADMATWTCPAASFDAIVTLYALIHVPLADQRRLIPRLAEWLVPGGYLLAIVGNEQWTGVENYLGAPMFWDHADAASYRQWLRDAGFTLIWDRFIPEGASGHRLVLAQIGK